MRKFLHLLFILIPVFMIVLLTSCKDFSKCFYLEKEGIYLLPSDDKSTFKVYGVKDYTKKTYEIPNEYEGKPIVAIAYRAFDGCDDLSEIVIPQNVTCIERRAFQGCTKLRNVTFNEGLKEIQSYSFYFCYNLISITIPSSVDTIEGSAFDECRKLVEIYNPSSSGVHGANSCIIHTSLDEASILTKDENGYLFANINDEHYLMRYDGEKTDIVLPDSYKYHNEFVNYELFEYAFAWHDNIKSVVVPENINKVSYSGFEHSALESITILGNVTKLGSSEFSGCANLKNVTLPNGLKEIGLSSFDNCSSLKSITLPSSVTKIDSSAFRGTKLESINLPDGLTFIGDWAFQNTSLSSITIPASVKEIESGVFLHAPLRDIYYLGTKEEWESIRFGITSNDEIKNATIHYAR